MKRSQTCPKCQSRAIACIRGFKSADSSIPASPAWINFSNVAVNRYVCTACGYTEEWVDDTAGLQKIKKNYLQQD